jgi:hypothetical protein
MNDTAALPQLVLCIPGSWENRAQILERVIKSSGGQYLFAGGVLMHVPTKDMFELEFQARDERMAGAFAAAGPHWFGSPEMNRIDSHQSVAYLLGYGGSDKNVEALMLAARALLDAGGFGVKIENSGLAHSPADWRDMCTGFAVFSPYRAFVIVVTGGGEAYSCGMHAFGMLDVQVIDEDKENALRTARSFSWYLFTERPTVKDGQTFSCDAQSPWYRISTGKGVEYAPDSLFINPYGTWQLQRL